MIIHVSLPIFFKFVYDFRAYPINILITGVKQVLPVFGHKGAIFVVWSIYFFSHVDCFCPIALRIFEAKV